MDITEILQAAVHSNNYWKHCDFISVTDPYLTVDPDIYNAYFDFMENLNAFSAEDFYFYNVN
ncbi:hypothetical protein LIV57_05290 [Chryseobacterium sp. X308]|uniref:hypothetical protein n=1 Tax=Chryseobacterium sp. X308 TaxID=2884873 RepID=UPI001D1591DA|nr:hypothetical protein [Chryseobacterium sp. X308]MCC3214674.1 hypothetical protein [Chryseobacterium sp. X308]